MAERSFSHVLDMDNSKATPFFEGTLADPHRLRAH